MEPRKWLVINYNLPTEPSRLRVAIWRSLKKLGAVNIQQSMWLMIHSAENYAILQKISQDIDSNNGEALLMECVFSDEKHEQRVITLFNALRDEEYHEFITECEKYFKEISKEIAIEKFTFAELEEEEEEHEKLLSWYAKIEARDIFHSAQRDCAEEKRDQVREAFAGYSELVYKYINK